MIEFEKDTEEIFRKNFLPFNLKKRKELKIDYTRKFLFNLKKKKRTGKIDYTEKILRKNFLPFNLKKENRYHR